MYVRRLFIALLLALVLLPPVAVASPGVLLTIDEPDLGQWVFLFLYGQEPATVAPGQVLNFSWFGEPELDDSTITGYRYGWDVTDVNDPDDPAWTYAGWADVLSAPPISFLAGTHSLAVLVTDDLGRVTSGTIVLTVSDALPTEFHSWSGFKVRWPPQE